MQGIFQKENTDKALKYGIYRHLPTYEKIIRNLVSFFRKKTFLLYFGAKTMWYLQFHVVCDKVCTSFNGLLFIICPPFDFYAVARPHSYSIKRSFIFKGSSLKLYGTPRLSGGFLIQKSHSPFMNDPFP